MFGLFLLKILGVFVGFAWLLVGFGDFVSNVFGWCLVWVLAGFWVGFGFGFSKCSFLLRLIGVLYVVEDTEFQSSNSILSGTNFKKKKTNKPGNILKHQTL